MGRAMFAAVINDLQMEFVPARFRKERFKIALGLQNALSGAEPPSFGEPVNMGVDRE